MARWKYPSVLPAFARVVAGLGGIRSGGQQSRSAGRFWAGVRGDRLHFRQGDGSFVRAFAPDPQVYGSFGVAPPPAQRREPEKERKLQEILHDAAARSWPILIFEVPRGGGGRPGKDDPYGETGYLAALQDVMNAFPVARDVIMDGPGEQHYELAWHHGGTRCLFHPDPAPGPSEWTIITRMCGNPWRQSRGGYWPPDSRPPDEYLRPPGG